jgi:hypothetical protein
MPTDIEVVPSPRPEPGQEPPLPGYHELLNQLCDEFKVPGSHDFSGAIEYIKEHYPTSTKKFIDWYLSQHFQPNTTHMELIAQNSVTVEGRNRLAQSYVQPARQRVLHLVHHRSSVRAIQSQASMIENFFQCFPEGERFIQPLMSLRDTLIELYSLMSHNYEYVADEARGYGEITPEQIQQVAAEQEEAGYTGPRPTRFEHLDLFDED